MKWKTLETSHFFIHFDERNERAARRLAAMADPIHDELTLGLQWAPQDKTHVVLNHAYDMANGSATPTPFNQIEIYLTPPEPTSELGDYDDWLRLVFTHEYTHILHLDQAFGPAKLMRDVLGRNFMPTVNGWPVPLFGFPNYLAPPWVLEGYATLAETDFSTAGRGDSSYAAMVVRMAALDNAWWPLDRGSGSEGVWPGGQFRYLFGEAFLDYLADKHGRDALIRTLRYNAWGVTPYLIDVSALAAAGFTFEAEWRNWRQAVGADATATLDKLRARGLTRPQPLTDDRWRSRNPRLSPDGKTLYYSVSDNISYPHVRALDLATGKVRTLFESSNHFGPVAPSPDGRYLYHTQLDSFERFYFIGDLFRYDTATGRLTRLTRGERLLGIDVSPDGSRLAGVRNTPGGQELVLYELHDDGPTPLRTLRHGAERVFDAPRFSPDGDHLVYSSWTPGGYTDIFITDMDGNELRLTHDRYLDLRPVFSGDGQDILFSSDRDGIYNLYRLGWKQRSLPAPGDEPPAPALPLPGNVTTATQATSPTQVSLVDFAESAAAEAEMDERVPRGAPERLTNVIGGIFDAQPLSDGSVIAAAYGGKGFYVASVPVAPQPETQLLPDRPAFESPYPESFTGTAEPYRPGATLWPRVWSPTLRTERISVGGSDLTSFEVGVHTSGRDVLGFHQYTATAFYNAQLERPGFAFNYAWDRHTPTLTLALEDVPRSGELFAQAATGAVTGIRSQGIAAGVILPFPQARTSQSLSLQYTFEREREFGKSASDPFALNTAAVTGQWVYRSSLQYPISISPQDGGIFSLTSRMASEALGGDFNELAMVADGRYYLTLGGRHVLAGQALGGMATSSGFAGPFSVGGATPRLTLADIGVVPLRGFAERTQDGNHLAKASLEYRFPLGLVKRGVPFWGTLPFLLDQFHGAVFADVGSAWSDRPDFLASAGAEVYLDFTLGYFFPISLGLGGAVPLNHPDGDNRPYFYLIAADRQF